MTPEEAQRIARLATAKEKLRAALNRIPFDLHTADATRIDVWKKLRQESIAALNRNGSDPVKYEDLLRRLSLCGTGKLSDIVQGVYENKEHGK